MGVSWLKAAEQNGIPTAFIVNKEGKIAWIGHPMEIDKPLEMVANGKWNLKVAAEEMRRENTNSGIPARSDPGIDRGCGALGQCERSAGRG